jgi:uncharacterized Rossmann fold enzyme
MTHETNQKRSGRGQLSAVLAICVALLAAFFVPAASAAPGQVGAAVTGSVSFQEGVNDYAGTRDASLDEAQPGTNFGEATVLMQLSAPGGQARSVTAWDGIHNAIPTGATVTSATITYHVSDTGGAIAAFPLIRPWNEGDVNWIRARIADDTDQNWGLPGANEPNVDHWPATIGSFDSSEAGAAVMTLNETGVQFVQSWIDDPTTNHGILLISDSTSDATFVRSSEYVTPEMRPQLTVNYTEAPAIVNGGFVGIEPDRVVDTRGEGAGPCVTGTRNFPVVPRDDVPADAAALALNVTVTESAGNGFLTVFPAGTTRPTASNLNFAQNQTVPNAVNVRVGAGGAVSVYASAGSCPHVVIDIMGYFTAGEVGPGGFVGINPDRAVDTRGVGAGPCVTGTRDFVLAPRADVPANAAALALNVTVTESAGNGFLTVFPAGTTRPTASNLNFARNQTVPNAVSVRVGTGGAVSVYASRGSCPHVVIDVMGYFAAGEAGPGGFVGIDPDRVVDTRGVGAGPCLTGTRNFPVVPRAQVPADAAGLALNVTVTEPVGNGFLTVFPAGTTRPVASNLNFARNETVPNAVNVRVGAGGAVSAYASAGSCPHVVMDIMGYYRGPAVA